MTATEIHGKRGKLKWYEIATLLFIIVAVAALVKIGLSSFVHVDARHPMVNTIVQIQTAIEAYDIEYDEMPNASSNAGLVKILSGDNFRKIQFIRINRSQLDSNGQVLDEWETPLRITIDTSAKVHVTSAGPDKIFGTADDITNQ